MPHLYYEYFMNVFSSFFLSLIFLFFQSYIYANPLGYTHSYSPRRLDYITNALFKSLEEIR